MNEKLLAPIQTAQKSPVIIFYNGQCLMRMNTQGGTTVERFISHEAFREAATGIPVDSGWLDPKIVRWGTGRLGEWSIAFIPPGRHRLEITQGTPGVDETHERLSVPLPGLVVFGLVNKYFVWAVKGEQLNPQHEVYRCPLPNVYNVNVELGSEKVFAGEICWGLLKPPEASARTLLKAFEIFISSTFNNHCASGKSKRHKDDVREMLRGLAAAGDDARYPADDLVRQVEHTGVTLDQAIKQFFESGEMPE